MKHYKKMTKVRELFNTNKKTKWNHKVNVGFYDGLDPYDRDRYDYKPHVTISVNYGKDHLDIYDMKSLKTLVHDLTLLTNIDGLFRVDSDKKYDYFINPNGVKDVS